MAKTVVAKLAVAVSASTASFSKGMEKARNKLKKFSRETKTTRSSIERLESVIGSSSKFNKSIEILAGAGAVAGLKVLGDQVRLLGESMRNYVNNALEGNASTKSFLATIASSIPLFSGFAMGIKDASDAIQDFRFIQGQTESGKDLSFAQDSAVFMAGLLAQGQTLQANLISPSGLSEAGKASLRKNLSSFKEFADDAIRKSALTVAGGGSSKAMVETMFDESAAFKQLEAFKTELERVRAIDADIAGEFDTLAKSAEASLVDEFGRRWEDAWLMRSKEIGKKMRLQWQSDVKAIKPTLDALAAGGRNILGSISNAFGGKGKASPTATLAPAASSLGDALFKVSKSRFEAGGVEQTLNQSLTEQKTQTSKLQQILAAVAGDPSELIIGSF